MSTLYELRNQAKVHCRFRRRKDGRPSGHALQMGRRQEPFPCRSTNAAHAGDTGHGVFGIHPG